MATHEKGSKMVVFWGPEKGSKKGCFWALFEALEKHVFSSSSTNFLLKITMCKTEKFFWTFFIFHLILKNFFFKTDKKLPLIIA